MVYALLYINGENGWRPGIQHVTERQTAQRTTMTMLQYAKYRIAIRPGFSLLHSAGKLYLQYVVDLYCREEATRLDFIRNNQKQIRAESYAGLIDYHHHRVEEENAVLGKMVILPSSFKSSPRKMRELCLDAMSLVQNFGRPSYFITMTMNAKCAEVTDNLAPHQKREYRPELISRIFNAKLGELLDDLTKKQVFGKVKYYFYTIEFQKRG